MSEHDLERKEVGRVVTALASPHSGTRVLSHPIHLTEMNHLRAAIPIEQQGGLLSIPKDDWAAFRALVLERFDATVSVTETTEGDTFNPNLEPGTPCLLVDIAVPVGPTRDEVIAVVDGPLNALIDRNIVRHTQQQAA